MDEGKVLSEYKELQHKVEISLEKHKNNKSLENMQELMDEIQILYNNEIKKESSIFLDIYTLPIKEKKVLDETTYEIFCTVYYLSIFFLYSETAKENKKIVTVKAEEKMNDDDSSENSEDDDIIIQTSKNHKRTKMENIFDKLYIFSELSKSKINELLSSKDSYENKIEYFSIFVSTFSLHINTTAHKNENYKEPILVNLDVFDSNHFYKIAFSFLKKIIDDLKETSYLVEPLMLLNSKITK